LPRRAGAVLALAALAVLLYLRPLCLGETFAARDHLTVDLPSRTYLASALREGRIPEWWDAIGLGIPFAANPQHGVVYPPAWLVAVLPMPWGSDALLLLHAFFAACGVLLLSRRFGASLLGATVAGGVFMASGYVASVVVIGIQLLTLAWTPWVAWAADRVGEGELDGRSRARRALCLAMVLGAQLLTGDPAGLSTSALVVLGVLFARGARGRATWWACGAAGVLALALAAVALLPALYLLPASERRSGMDLSSASVWSLHPLRMLEWAWPNLLGRASEPTLSLARIWADAGSASGLEPQMTYSVYLGAPVLLLVVAGAFSGQRGLRGVLVTSLALVVLALGAFTPAYAAFRFLFVPERLVRYPEKHLAGVIVLWSALAGVGFSRVFLSHASRRFFAATLAAAAALAVGVLMAWWGEGALLAASLSKGAARLPPLGVADALDEARGGGRGALLVAVVFSVAVAFTWRPRLARTAPWLAALLLLGPLVGHTWQVQPLVSRLDVTRAPAILPAISAPRSLRPRLYRPQNLVPPLGSAPWSSARAMALWLHDTAVDNTGAAHGLAHVPGFDAAVDPALHTLYDRAVRDGAGQRLLEVLGVQFAVLPSDAHRPTKLALRATWDEVVLAENLERRPRAFVAGRWIWTPTADPTAVLRPRTSSTVDPVHLVGEGPLPLEPPTSLVPCEALSPRAEIVVLECTATAPGYVVLLDAWAAGWTAFVDGQPSKIERADTVARAVRIPQGRHVVRFAYATPGLRSGLVVSLVAWLGVLGGLAAARALGRRMA
jgi:hypothetical protein